MNIEQKKAFIINLIYYSIMATIIFVILKYGFYWFTPFVIGFFIAYMLKPIINKLTDKTHIKRKKVAIFVLVLFYATVGTLMFVLITKLVFSIKEILGSLPQIYTLNVQPAITILFDNFENFFSKLDPKLVYALSDVTNGLVKSISDFVTSISSGTIGIVSGFATSVPAAFIVLIFSIVSSFFFSLDYYSINKFVLRQLSEKSLDIFTYIKEFLGGTIFKMIKAYALLMFVTFAELSLGFKIIGVSNVFAVAAIIAVLDILPVIGTGGIVLPWAVIEFVKGDLKMGIGLVAIYLVIVVVRNVLEPKVVGEQIGLHPLIMLICMFIGAKIFGFLGLFILPIMAIVIKNLNDTGRIHMFK